MQSKPGLYQGSIYSCKKVVRRDCEAKVGRVLSLAVSSSTFRWSVVDGGALAQRGDLSHARAHAFRMSGWLIMGSWVISISMRRVTNRRSQIDNSIVI
jgi:hypothetical protein